jgi:hypothetical protein
MYMPLVNSHTVGGVGLDTETNHLKLLEDVLQAKFICHILALGVNWATLVDRN